MRVLVTGAHGFIGSAVVASLLRAGHEPLAAVRSTRRGDRLVGIDTLACDFSTDVDPSVWMPRLVGIEAVVNCAGILRESGVDRHERVHVDAPAALFEACVRSGVRRFVQISALGEPNDGEFIASKHRGDAILMASNLDWVVLRPSVVMSTQASYGGTSLLRALAALPVIPLPGDGDQTFQPLAMDDLCRAVLAALTRDEAVHRCLELGGPHAITLREYLGQWRRWLGLGRPRFLRFPRPIAALAVRIADRLGRGPLGLTLWRMLERGNVVAADSLARTEAALGFAPIALERMLALRPSSSADRWHARLHLLAPVLRAVLGLTWVASALVGMTLPRERILALFAETWVPGSWALFLGWSGSLADLLLGLALLAGWQPRRVLALMAAMVLGYSVFIGAILPSAWLDPFGGLIKNGVILLALAVAAVTTERN